MKLFLKDNFVILFISVLFSLSLITSFFIEDSEDRFRQYIADNEQSCVDRARRNNKDYSYCTESYKTAKLAFDMANQRSEDEDFFYFSIILFISIIGILGNSKQIQKLKQNTDV